MIRNRMTKYTAPSGYVYDWKEPHFNEDGSENHLYVSQLFLTRLDNIKNYKIVKKPSQDGRVKQ